MQMSKELVGLNNVKDLETSKLTSGQNGVVFKSSCWHLSSHFINDYFTMNSLFLNYCCSPESKLSIMGYE